jgi:hypothetical protein
MFARATRRRSTRSPGTSESTRPASEIREKACGAIAEAHPELSAECDRQLDERRRQVDYLQLEKLRRR